MVRIASPAIAFIQFISRVPLSGLRESGTRSYTAAEAATAALLGVLVHYCMICSFVLYLYYDQNDPVCPSAYHPVTVPTNNSKQLAALHY